MYLSSLRLYKIVLLTWKAQKEKRKETLEFPGFVLPLSYPSINVYIYTAQKMLLAQARVEFEGTITVFPRTGKTVGNKLVYNMHIYTHTHIHKHIHSRIKV